MYCTALDFTVLRCAISYCTLLYCTTTVYDTIECVTNFDKKMFSLETNLCEKKSEKFIFLGRYLLTHTRYISSRASLYLNTGFIRAQLFL